MPHRIIVFNHSPNVLLLIESILKQKGFDVFTFLETMTDVAKVAELTPDLVIIGHVRGFAADEMDIVYEFRNSPDTAHIPIILCTTGAAQVRQNGDLANIAQVSIVAKPFDMHQLLEAVYTALNLPIPKATINKSNEALTDAPTII